MSCLVVPVDLRPRRIRRQRERVFMEREREEKKRACFPVCQPNIRACPFHFASTTVRLDYFAAAKRRPTDTCRGGKSPRGPVNVRESDSSSSTTLISTSPTGNPRERDFFFYRRSAIPLCSPRRRMFINFSNATRRWRVSLSIRANLFLRR